MKIISILLIILGIAGLGTGGMMFGDIGLAAMIAGGAALLSGIGILISAKRLTALEVME